MPKNLFIAEKPSVAREFARVLGDGNGGGGAKSADGYLESDSAVFTWCVGHLITMCYPDAYDPKYKRWSLAHIPFIPDAFKYEVISSVKKQYKIVSTLLKRKDIQTIYVCTDSGREGEYIYRLVEQMAGRPDKERRRVWIDSQTADEIRRGVREAQDLAAYDNLSAAAYLRAKEDYLMGINFSRALTLKYSGQIKARLKTDKAVVAVGRVMTCVLGMVVRREREIRDFKVTTFYRVLAQWPFGDAMLEAEWRADNNSRYYNSPLLYKENGFKDRRDAEALINYLQDEGAGHPTPAATLTLTAIEKKKEKKAAPLLYNLAELQNDCARRLKINPDESLRIAQELYEKKLISYPRTDARVLSSAIAKEIEKNVRGLAAQAAYSAIAEEILAGTAAKKIKNTRYVDDAKVGDHFAIIPTGQGLSALGGLSALAGSVYELIVRRFLAIFYPPAVYEKLSLTFDCKGESFSANYRALADEGYLAVMAQERASAPQETELGLIKSLAKLKPGYSSGACTFNIKAGETTPPKRYNSGSLILAMENAGQLIEDEELRAEIKSSGIGTAATRAAILKKLINIKYLALNKKTQIITPSLLGEMIFDIVERSIKPLLNPALSASWEKGLRMVEQGLITEDEYMKKLCDFVIRHTNHVKEGQT